MLIVDFGEYGNFKRFLMFSALETTSISQRQSGNMCAIRKLENPCEGDKDLCNPYEFPSFVNQFEGGKFKFVLHSSFENLAQRTVCNFTITLELMEFSSSCGTT